MVQFGNKCTYTLIGNRKNIRTIRNFLLNRLERLRVSYKFSHTVIFVDFGHCEQLFIRNFIASKLTCADNASNLDYPLILAIESSCDESALALFDPQQGIVGEWIYSQIDLHQTYGGVVPDLASREHLLHFGPMLKTLQSQFEIASVSEIVVTCGPGLAGCLAVGIALAKSLVMLTGVPLYGIHHLRGHAFSPFIDLHAANPDDFDAILSRQLPHLGLIVSGGNTLLLSIGTDRSLKIVAQTVDDAAGEALDKGAKLLGMPYPGGPLIEQTARTGNPKKFAFPKAMASADDMRFSFSGLKTALRYQLEKMPDTALKAAFSDICASYQQAVIAQLVKKADQALAQSSYKSIGLSGGVANNQRLRTAFENLAKRKSVPLYIPCPQHTGDNAGMIGFAAWADPAGKITDCNYNLTFQPALGLNN